MNVTHKTPHSEVIRTVPSVVAGRILAPERVAGLASSVNSAEALEVSRDLLATSKTVTASLYPGFIEASRAWQNLADALSLCEVQRMRSSHAVPTGQAVHKARKAFAEAVQAVQDLF